jgi:hypothetical protein
MLYATWDNQIAARSNNRTHFWLDTSLAFIIIVGTLALVHPYTAQVQSLKQTVEMALLLGSRGHDDIDPQ